MSSKFERAVARALGRRVTRTVPALALAGAALAGCDTDRIVEVDNPNQLGPETVAEAGATASLVQGAVLIFRGGYSGYGDDSFLSSSGLITDELYYGDTFPTRQAYDQRRVQPVALGNISDGSYSRLQAARVQSRRAFAQILQFSSASTAAADSVSAALMRNIEGMTYVTLAEGWCGNVPFTIVPDSGLIDPTNLTGTRGLTTAEMLDTSLVRFREALRYRPNDNLARVARGRAFLDAGQFDSAFAAVQGVPLNFVYRIEHSTNTGGQNNPMAQLMQNGRYGVANLEGGTFTNASGATVALRPDTGRVQSNATAEGLPFRAFNDPRIPYVARPNCFTSSVRCWLNNNYPAFAASVPLASGVEARLVVAEVLYRRGQYTAMLDSLNALRASVATLTSNLYPQQVQTFAPATLAALPATAIADAETARRTVFQERAFWLYNTGHRLGDLRRLARAPYSLATNQVFPSGPFFRGGTYGDDVNFPVPQQELNNPEYNAAQCVTTAP